MTGPRVKEFPDLTEMQLSLIAPVKDGKPDLYNYVPTRNVSNAEAQTRGWKWFYIGDVCSHGHKAPRYVSNPRLCVDCHRVREGRQTIGGKGNAEYTTRIRTYKERETKHEAGAVVAVQPRPLEPDALEKRFLTEYAKLRSFDAASQILNTDSAVFRARLSYSKVFLDAVNALEDSEGLSRTLKMDEEFAWDDDKRLILIRVYIDTGDLGLARDSIQVSNYHYQRELQANPDFARAVVEAEPLANRILDEHAVRKAKQGDSRLLDRVLSAKMPNEYGAKLKVDMNVTEKLSDAQVNARIVQLFRLLGNPVADSPVIDAEYTELESPGEDGDFGAFGDEVSAPEPQSNLDLL